MTIIPLPLLLLLLHKTLISQLQRAVRFGETYEAFFTVHFALSFALYFAFLSPSPKIYDFYFNETEKKAKEFDPFFLRSEKWGRKRL